MSRAADELEIRTVLALLAQLADSGETDRYLSLLTGDVVWTMPANLAIGLPASERKGHDEIAGGQRERIAAGQQGPGSNTMHTVSTVSVEFTADDVAIARSSFVFWTATASTPTPTTVGRYVDEFRRASGDWKLARRTITIG